MTNVLSFSGGSNELPARERKTKFQGKSLWYILDPQLGWTKVVEREDIDTSDLTGKRNGRKIYGPGAPANWKSNLIANRG